MDLVGSIISSTIYDLIKVGGKLTFQTVFGNFYGKGINNNIQIYTDFLNKINEKKSIDEKKSVANSLLKSEQILYIFEHDLYNTNFSKRLDYIIYLINQANYFNLKINLEFLGEWLGFSSVNELKKYYLYTEEPDYSFIDKIAEKLGINNTWLKHGINANPFQSKFKPLYNPLEILQHEPQGRYVFIIKDSNTRPEILILKKVNTFKYVFFPRAFVFHSQVGGTGANELYLIYCLLKKLDKQQINLAHVHILPEKIFNDLLEGKIYPGTVEKYPPNNKIFILDDFLNLSNQKTNNFKKLYGDEFVNAQEIVKKMICENS